MESLEHGRRFIWKGDVAHNLALRRADFPPTLRAGRNMSALLPTLPPELCGFSRGHPLDPGSEGSALSALSCV